MIKIFNQKCFNYFFTPLGSRVNILINFFLQVYFRCQQSDIVPLFATGINNTRTVLVAKFVVDTGRKFVTGVVNTSGAP
jgi:hypothetical protein